MAPFRCDSWLSAAGLALGLASCVACGNGNEVSREPEAAAGAGGARGECAAVEAGAPSGSDDLCGLLAAACTETSGPAPSISPLSELVPSSALPTEVETQFSHNNLDGVWHQGRLYFAFRVAPAHFAGTDVVLYVISTHDHVDWRLETSIALGRDVREPRFLSLAGRLHLFFAVLGTEPLAFEPLGTRVTTLADDCSWSEPEQVLPRGFILWRARPLPEGGRALVSGYVGGEDIYSGSGEPLDVYLLETQDARHFEPAAGADGVVLHGGSSETDFAWLADGDLLAVARNEAGDEQGFGSKICRAAADDLADWQCASDLKKYDSPLLFRHGAEAYLLARRNLTDSGAFDLQQSELSLVEQQQTYGLDYWGRPKRCALWRVDPDELTVEHVLDLPSAGDTCYPALVQLEPTRYLVYNYSSPLDQPDLAWYEGQQTPTSIHGLVLELP
ncbi:MAG TPA: hypothetical protein VJN18_35970 [Polyangiaceae bacterium]|nr:hypothetical protein [Polyangiaceae bacterium]